MSIIQPPCHCLVCQDEAPPESDRKFYGCKYNNIHWPSANLFSRYKLLVMDNNTSLLDLPYEYYQVGQYYSYYSNMKLSNDMKKKEDERKQRELFERFAPRSK